VSTGEEFGESNEASFAISTSTSVRKNSIVQTTKDSTYSSSREGEANFYEILTNNNARELTFFMFQLDIKNNANLFNIVKFIDFLEFNTNLFPENCCGELIDESYKKYRELFSRLNQRDYKISYKIEPNLLDLLSSIDIPSILTKISSIENFTKMLNIFINISSSEQKNMISIVKFIYYYKINELEKGGVFWRPISEVLSSYSHKNWQIYSELVKQIKALLANQCI
jgi:hypothetical protein